MIKQKVIRQGSRTLMLFKPIHQGTIEFRESRRARCASRGNSREAVFASMQILRLTPNRKLPGVCWLRRSILHLRREELLSDGQSDQALLKEDVQSGLS